MVAAMEAVSSGMTSINKAAVMYGVPCPSLKDCMSGRVVHGTKPGQKRYLDEDEEGTPVDHLFETASMVMGRLGER